jgi:hypothetical protein
MFVEGSANNGIHSFRPNNESLILWVNGHPPLDEPEECGFEGCSTNWSYMFMCYFTAFCLASLVGFFVR